MLKKKFFSLIEYVLAATASLALVIVLEKVNLVGERSFANVTIEIKVNQVKKNRLHCPFNGAAERNVPLPVLFTKYLT